MKWICTVCQHVHEEGLYLFQHVDIRVYLPSDPLHGHQRLADHQEIRRDFQPLGDDGR